MKSLRALKKRIKSIKNTAKITNALEKVSISKMKKFQTLASQSIEYANEVAILATLVAGIVKDNTAGLDKKVINRYFKENNTSAPVALIVIAPTRGFCGSLISDMLNVVFDFIEPAKEYLGIGMQKKSWYILSKFPEIKLDTLFEKPIETPTFESIRSIFEYVIENYIKGKYSKILIYFSEYKGSFDYEPTLKQLLPLDYEELLKYIDTDSEKAQVKKDFIIEPDKNTVFTEIIDRYLRTIFLYSLISAKASEHNARMIAMKNATDNANQLKDMLNLQFNKSRQEAITTELLDIVGGNIN